MGLTFKKTDKLEKLFEEFAIDPDKKEEKIISEDKEIIVDEVKKEQLSTEFKVDIKPTNISFKVNEK